MIFSSAGARSAEEPEKTRTKSARRWKIFSGLFALCVVFSSIYIVFKASTLFNPGYTRLEWAVGFALLFSEVFLFLHMIGFILNLIRSMHDYKTVEDSYFAHVGGAKVSCLICSYNESPAILEETINCVKNLDYPNKEVILLDDSQGEFKSAAKALGQKYKIQVFQREERKGYKAGAINAALPRLRGEYIAIFDADQKPVQNFIRNLVFLLEEDDKIALIQTPQYYANTDNAVAFASGNRQSIFYEYICEGKSTTNSMFCCGSNLIFRKKALEEVGGFDESSVTEDFATTLKIHKNGWKTLYYNHVYVNGMGPDTLGGYFSQQYRWAHGTVTLFKEVIASFVKNPFALKPSQWWEYFLSSTYFFSGWSNFVFMIVPVLFLLFNLRPLIADTLAYVVAFIPYFTSGIILYVYSMRERGLTARDLFLGQSIALIAFSVYMVADVAALLGIKTKFVVTPKGKATALPLSMMSAQTAMLILLLLAIIVGVVRGAYTWDLIIWVNVFWSLFHFVLLSYFFILNFREKGNKEETTAEVFRRVMPAAIPSFSGRKTARGKKGKQKVMSERLHAGRRAGK